MGDVVPAALHAAPVDEVGAAPAGDYVTAAHIHRDAHHAMGGPATPAPAAGGGRHDSSDWCAGPRLCVEVGPSTGLAVQLPVGVVGIGCATG